MPTPKRPSAAAAAAASRPAFARPPNPRRTSGADAPSPKRSTSPKRRTPDEERKATRSGARRGASESPAKAKPRRTSPTKDRDPYRAAEGNGERRKSGSPTKKRRTTETQEKHLSDSTTASSSQGLSIDSLAKLDALNEKAALIEKDKREKDEKRERKKHAGGGAAKRKKRVVSGALLEEGRGGVRVKRRGGADGDGDARARRREGSSKRGFWIFVIAVIVALIIFIPVGIVVTKKNSGSGGGGGGGGSSSGSSGPSTSGLNGVDPSSIPAAAKGTYLDPFTWYDTTDFNCTYTNETVGGLPVMGLKSSWDDSARANDQVPALNKPFGYGKQPIRGVNIGGWLSLEPFITPSLFDYPSLDNVVDEYTLTQKLGPSAAATTLEKHYSTFVTEQTFSDIQNAGMDHVRIPYSYWAVTTYPGDPYVPKISWRYLLRGIEYARKYGLRVNLDLHALPGSQNGWNHSGRQGAIGWLNGTDGALNAQRALDLHKQLSAFFAQDRYKNVVALYGLVNEPKMIKLPVDSVLAWTTSAIEIVRNNGMEQIIAFADGFLGLENWHGKLQGVDDHMVLDAHQYVIFNTQQINLAHEDKINFACSGWGNQMTQSNSPATGWGPTICGEWSQADTDCAQYLNNVGVGSRWTGTMNTQDPSTQVLSPTCPQSPSSAPCTCGPANADPSSYTPEYKKFLQTFAEAQMNSFEKGWGWFYWTWETESAVQWSWKLGLQAGILPAKAYQPDFTCGDPIPSLESLPENY